MKDFVLEYNAKLADVREVLSPTLTEAWDSVNETIELDLEPINTIQLRTLIKAESNPKIAKVITVFATLIDEIKKLKHIAETQFYGPLTMYGHKLEPVSTTESTHFDAKLLQQYYQTKPTPAEEQMGQFLPILQDLCNFVKRVQALIANYIGQLASLYNDMNQIYLSTFKTVEFDYVFEQLGVLFTVVITLDGIIADNPELTNHWNVFQKMVQYISGDIDRFGIKKQSDVNLMKQLIITINERIMNVRLFEEVLKYPYTLNLQTGETTLDDTEYQEARNNSPNANQSLQQMQTTASKPPQTVVNHPILGNKVFANVLSETIQRLVNKVSTSLKDFVEVYTFDRTTIIGVYALYSLSRTLHCHVLKWDKSLYRTLWELQTTVPLIPIYAKTSWYIADFLYIYARAPQGYEKDYFKPYLKNVPAARKEVLIQQQEEFLPRIQVFSQQVNVWLVRLESDLSVTNIRTATPGSSATTNILSGDLNNNTTTTTTQLSPQQLLHTRCNILLHGLLLASQIKKYTRTILNLYLHLEQPFPKRTLYALFTAMELLKVIQIAYQRKMLSITEYFPHIITFLTNQLISILQPVFNKLDGREVVPTKLNNTKQDIHGSLYILLNILKTKALSISTTNKPNNTNVDIVLFLCLQITQLQHLIKHDIQNELSLILWKLTTLLQFNTTLTQLTDCSFLYWVSNAIGFILHDIFASSGSSQGVDRVKYLALATRDCSLMLDAMTKPFTPYHVQKVDKANVTTLPMGQMLQKIYEAEVRTYFRSKLILPIARYIETDLRLHIHSVVLQQQNLVGKYQHHQQTGNAASAGVVGSLDAKSFILVAPFKLFDHLYNIKNEIESVLEETFYNHNTLALHDSKVYGDMKNLAINKYNLDFLPITMLPTSSHFSDSLDVLEIMRNIHIFVTRYNYNLHQQFFLEKSIDQKHLNVINIDHIATSIQTHGLGIMNTTVNFTYQFLTRKVTLIHEFLFDEQIKSPLFRELKQWRIHGKKDYNNKYPFANAAKLYKELKRLGVNEQGLSYIDQLRLQITEIGNALGYVRLVRSGGLHVVAQNTSILPSLDLDLMKKFALLCDHSKLSPSTILSAKHFDAMLENIIGNLSDGTNYFYILITIFRNILILQDNPHLQCFFMAIPMLIINYVETLMSKKEKLPNKNTKQEAAFCDDGFAVGISYLLTLLKQDDEFDSIHWFESVLEHLKEQRNTLANEIQQATKQKNKSYDFEHNQLNLTRQDNIIQEYTLCYFGINSSRVFFRSAVELQDDLDKQEKKAQEDDDEDDE